MCQRDRVSLSLTLHYSRELYNLKFSSSYIRKKRKRKKKEEEETGKINFSNEFILHSIFHAKFRTLVNVLHFQHTPICTSHISRYTGHMS